ncbi:hypothetical protein KNU62_gp64 [Gordonia phage Bakery]|uniref:Phage Gp37/Gp68 family protein n=1 Tax=Gordonia phage Bakery TaxID=2591205 RepID=A0A514DGW3_9CAUD|nr:hypothetical protein KNU62_gp64 [Gordonia phage Bakery]QDH92849.1 hypothetical protein SEA_BAKERY_64 [Gordonia phage Bakery]
MSDRTGIEWTDATWNPVTGCTKVSAGCDHCYAETLAERFRGTAGHYFENGFDVQLRENKLREPLGWRKPRKVFVNSMSDLFHDAVPDEYISRVFAMMALTPQHTYQVLTKRHARMRALLSVPDLLRDYPFWEVLDHRWPLPNVWLGVSTENQQWAEIRIPALLDTPAAVRFISAEPLLGPVRLCCCITAGPDLEGPSEFCWMHGRSSLDWVIVGGESGRGARPMHPQWARDIRDQCVAAGVPFLFKQWGQWGLEGDTAHYLATDGTLYAPGDLTYPDGPRYADALRAGHNRGLHTVYRVGKGRAGRELDGRTWDQYPENRGATL